MNSTKRLAVIAVMVSQAMILSLVESMLPIPPIVTGMKLGLANIVTLLAIIFLGYGDALTVVIIRCILSSFFSGGLIFFLFSISGGVLSVLVMALLYKKMSKALSLTGISIAGALAHNTGQVLIACIVMKTAAVLGYMPLLLGASVVMGCFTGLCSGFLSSALKKINIISQ